MQTITPLFRFEFLGFVAARLDSFNILIDAVEVGRV